MKFLFRDQSQDLSKVIIEAERIQLQPVSMDFVSEIFNNFTPEITQYMVPASLGKLSDTVEFVEKALRGIECGDDFHLVILPRKGREFLGICALHSKGNPKEPELGIWIKKAAHGHGYGMEAIAALVHWAEVNLEFERLIYPVDRRNLASRRIPERLGGKIISQKKVKSMAGTELDEVIYGIEPQVPDLA